MILIFGIKRITSPQTHKYIHYYIIIEYKTGFLVINPLLNFNFGKKIL